MQGYQNVVQFLVCVVEVRYASVESVCQLSLDNPQFAHMSLDFLVDMFNDEIEDVRIKAIDSLTRISRHIVLREDQLETILGALKDFSMDVREGLHKMLASCRLSSKNCLQMCVESLLENLKKYPMQQPFHSLDPPQTHRATKELGKLVYSMACLGNWRFTSFPAVALQSSSHFPQYKLLHSTLCALHDQLQFVALRVSLCMYTPLSYLVDVLGCLVAVLGCLVAVLGCLVAVLGCLVAVLGCLVAVLGCLDRRSTWHCLQKIGQSHPELTLPLVPELLAIHPFFDTPEPDVEDPACILHSHTLELELELFYNIQHLYVCILILVFNAAQQSPTMLQLFEEHTLKHYSYLRDTMPTLVPALKVVSLSMPPRNLLGSSRPADPAPLSTGSAQYLSAILARIETAPSSCVRRELMEACRHDLSRLATIDRAIPGALQFSALYISSQLLMMDILSNKLWSNPSALASQQGNVVKNCISQLLSQCLKLQHLYVGLNTEDLSCVKQFKLKALALQLVYIVRGSNFSALALCEHFLETVEDTQRYLSEHEVQPEVFTSALFKELGLLEDTKPGPVARCLLPLLQVSTPAPLPHTNIEIRSSMAVISEPTGDLETALKFTAGLVLGVHCDALLHNIQDISTLRIKVKYPDQQTHLLVPRPTDLRPLEPPDHRLLTTVLLSHHVWTEACIVEVSLALDVARAESGLAGRKVLSSGSVRSDDPWVLDLCRPVKVLVSPKPIKRGI
uniref:Integrator complex subunit 4 n=1 Tax=Timema bartmani TaxID=61472 RepID=A0A7R9EWS5_9NEOP|nr:unnamed protein product [Timema bartmani]